MADNHVRVFICGAHSTGKTTLIKEVSKRIKIHVESELVRDLIKDLGLVDFETRNPETKPEVFKFLHQEIIKAQYAKQEELYQNDYIMDRGIDALAYVHVYLGKSAYEEFLKTDQTQKFIKRFQNSINFVIKPFQECFSDDGFRMIPTVEEVNKFTETLRMILEEHNIPYHYIEVLDLKERRNQVIEVVRQTKPEVVIEEN